MQFSNLYDSALFNQRPLFPLQSNTHSHRNTHSVDTGGLGELVKVTYLIYNAPVLFHLLLLKAFNFYGGTALSKLCLVEERRLVVF